MTPNRVLDGGLAIEVWLVAHPGIELWDDEVRECKSRRLEIRPLKCEWLRAEVREDGWESLLQVWPSGDEHLSQWMLSQGIAPGQPFKVRISRPEYVQDYWGECDVMYGAVEVVEVRPWSRKQTARAWAAFASEDNAAVALPLLKASMDRARQHLQNALFGYDAINSRSWMRKVKL